MPRCRICNSPESHIKVSLDVDGAPTDIAFCSECARKFEMDMDSLERKGLPDFLGRCKAFGAGTDPSEPAGLSCPNCGLAAEEVLAQGKAGCAFCYIIFRNLPIQKVSTTDRRMDVLVSGECECKHESPEILERLLQEAVSEEDYETAARIRDRLHDTSGSTDES